MGGAKKQRRRNVATDFSVYFCVRLLLCILQALPRRACLNLAGALAWVFCDVIRFREKVVDDNLTHAFPEITAKQRRTIARGMWRHLMLLICEIARAHRKIHETNWREHVSFEGCRQLVASQLTDRALVIVTAHLGNFEISGYVAGILGLPNFTVARPLDNPFLHQFMVRFRESTGQRIISSRGSADAVGAAVVAGRTLAILGDHYGGPKGCWVDFFNRQASCHKSVALLCLNYRVPLLVFNTRRSGGLLRFEMIADADLFDPANMPELPSVEETTQWYTSQIESAIRKYPDQYWWLHRRWKDTRGELRRNRLRRRADLRIDGEGVALPKGTLQSDVESSITRTAAGGSSTPRGENPVDREGTEGL